MGHLILAEQCRDQASLDQVWFMPSAHPPHKADKPVTCFEQRCEMLELAIAGHTAFRIERIEKDLPPPSYTAETLVECHNGTRATSSSSDGLGPIARSAGLA